jgi:TolB-like protein/Tfp pilus assembly protein PilF
VINILYFNPSGQINAASVEKSIAILPFKNMSNEGDNQYFADGIMEAILNDLSGIGELTVIPGTSVEQYRSTTKTATQIGNELDVNYLLTGSAQLYGEKVRITVKLIDAQKDTQIWSENYDRELSDIFVTQSEIAERVGTALEAKLTLKEKEILQSAPTNNLEAYDLYLRGNEYAKNYLNKLEYPDYKNASDLYKKALESDPDFALAYVGLAEIYYERNYFREYMDEQPLDSMLLLCNQALSKDENLAEAYTLRGQYYYWMENSVDIAKQDFNRALSINPNYLPAMFELSDLYAWEKNLTESFRILINSARLVKGADRTELYSNIAGIYLHIGEYEKAEYYLDEVLKLEPDNVGAYGFLAHINRCQRKFEENLPIADILLRINPEGRALYDLAIINMMNGRYKESEKYFRQLYSSTPDIISMSGYGDKHMYSYVLMKNGKEEEARLNLTEVRDFMLDVITRERQWTKDLGYELAKVYALLGDKDEALKWLDLYNENGMSAGLHDFALYDPPLESLREDPRFLEIIDKANMQIAEDRKKILDLEASLEMDQWLNR